MTATDPSSQRIGEVILQQVVHMDRMICAILDLSCIERIGLASPDSAVELLRVIELAVEECRPELESKGQRLIVQMPESSAWLKGDEPRLVQIIRSLLDNAVKFTPEGGSIRISITLTDSHAQIQVQDSGCGLTEAHLSQVFTPFALAKSLHADGGMGISLAVTKRLVELHAGTIRAESAGQGQGSQFSVCLPLEGSRAPQPDR